LRRPAGATALADGPAATGSGPLDLPAIGPREARARLRDLNAAVVAQLALVTRQTHAAVNAELNRRAGIRRVTEATLPQLQRRVDAGRAWLDDARRASARR
jgi:hypothetical protein